MQPRFQSPGGAVLIQTLLLIPPLSIPVLHLPCASLCISQAECSPRAVTPLSCPSDLGQNPWLLSPRADPICLLFPWQ